MSMISYASGARFINLLGGEMLSFTIGMLIYHLHLHKFGVSKQTCQNPVIGTTPHIMMWGSNVPLTRTPDAHFMTEVRYKGAKVISVAPDYAENVKMIIGIIRGQMQRLHKQ